MKSVGINDIAEKIGVSRNTVSKVLNNRGSVAEKTKKEIIEAAIELGYKKTLPEWIEEEEIKNIVVIANSPDFSNYWGKIIHGITNYTVKKGYNCFYHFLTPQQVQQFTLPHILTQNNISGIIVMNVYEEKAIELLSQLEIPTVYFDIPLTYNYSNVKGDLIIVEGRRSVAEITENLIKQGNTKIGFIGDITYCKSIYERWCGFERMMKNYNLQIEEKYCLTHSPKGRFYQDNEVEEQLERLLQNCGNIPEAFVCANDVIAYKVINKLAKQGYHVPKHIKISGFDDIEENSIQNKRLTSVRINTEEIGIRLAEQMIWRIAHKNRQYEIIKIIGEVMERESTE